LVKVVFLIGDAKEIVDLWSGKTKKGVRTLNPSKIKINGTPLEARAIERKGDKRVFSFLFITLDSRRVHKIPEIIGRLCVDPRETVIIATDKEKRAINEAGFGDRSNKRYQLGYFLVILLKKISYGDVNEIASVLFFNHEKEMQEGRLAL
jgi:hypothetical protein